MKTTGAPMPSLFDTESLFEDTPSPSTGRFDGADAARAVSMDAANLRGRGSGCASPGLGCNRGTYTTAAAPGYLQKGYDSGRWWLK